MELEIWADVEDTQYKVSTFGRIIGIQGRIIQLSKDGCGYLHFRLYKNNVGKPVKVHRLVAKAFIENVENKPQVNHIDGNKLNNYASNLEWATGRENIAHAVRTGLIHMGEAHTGSVLTEHDIARIFSLEFQNKSNEEIAKIFNVHSSTIYGVRKGRTWKSLDFPRLNEMPRTEQTLEVKQKRAETQARGEQHGLSVLTENVVFEILELFKIGLTNQKIADLCGISRNTIYDIRVGNTWQHVTGGSNRLRTPLEQNLKKLFAEDIPLIRKMSEDGLTNYEIGKKFNVHNGTIHAILSGKTWKNY